MLVVRLDGMAVLSPGAGRHPIPPPRLHPVTVLSVCFSTSRTNQNMWAPLFLLGAAPSPYPATPVAVHPSVTIPFSLNLYTPLKVYFLKDSNTPCIMICT
ncbi:hypothetical protein HanIR_Chr17g0863801 [Helianthus annuus]|nr:hypothetical protein HanIR_Chr17g0863801 [Helianthus annuus]